MADLQIVATLLGRDEMSGAVNNARNSLGQFVKGAQSASTSTQSSTGAMGKAFGALGTAITAPIGAIGKLAGAVGAGLGVAAGFAVFNSLGAAIGAAGGAAIGFEKSMSAVKAVAGATGPEMQALSGLALQLGKDTSFSASEAAQGIGELVKGGVSIADVLGGSAAAALNLAAAGSISVGSAAEIAAVAMSQFGLAGGDMAKVSDLIAGAANASSIEVTDFKLSLNAVGAVANLAGQSFDDTATAIAVMGAAGIKGSDAGTSLKTMLLSLQPATDKAAAEFKRLGIVTADGANQFFDATGKAKGMADISQVLQNSLAGMTEQQKLASLEILFGSDAIRAGAILSKEGADGFNTMAAAMGKVTAESVAMEKLNNVAGDIEQLKGSLETAAIVLVGTFAPAFRPAIQAATALTNRFTQEAQTIIQTAQNMAGAHGIGMLSAVLSAIELRIGEVFGPGAQAAFHALRAAVETVGQALSGDLTGALTRMGVPLETVQTGMDAVATAGGLVMSAADGISTALGATVDWLTQTKGGAIALGAAMGALTAFLGIQTTLWVAHKIAMIAGSIATYAMTAAQWALNVALTANPIGIVIVFLAALAGALIAAYKTNEDFRNFVDKAWEWLKTAAGALKDAIGAALEAIAPYWNTLVGAITTNAATMKGQFVELGEAAGALSIAVGNGLEAISTRWGALVRSNDTNSAVFRKTWADIGAAVQGAVATMISALGPLKAAWDVLSAFERRDGPAFMKAWDALAKSVKDNATVVREETAPVAPAVAAMATDVGEALGSITPAAEEAAAGMGAAMDALPDAVQAQASPVASAAEEVSASLDTLGPGASAAVALASEALDTLPAAVEGQAAPVAEAVGAISASLDTLGPGAAVAVAGAGDALSALPAEVTGQVPGVTEGVGAVSTALGALEPGAQGAVDAAGTALATLPGQVSAQSGPASIAATGVGSAIASGMAAGIRAGLGWVTAAASNLATAASNAAKAALGIASPSRVFEELGEQTVEGFVEGVEGTTDDLIGAVEAMLHAATETAEDGTAAFVDTFDSLGDLIGAQFERAYTIVEAAQMKALQAIEDEEGNHQRRQDVEGRKHERRMADLQEAARRATVEQRKGINEKIAQEQEHYQQRLEDLTSSHADKLIDLELDGMDAVRAAQERQNLERGKALRELQRGVESLEEETETRANAIHQKAEEARTEAFRTAAEGIEDANQRVEGSIRDLLARRDEGFALRDRRDTFSVGQDDDSRVFSQEREDVDLVLRQTEQIAERRLRLGQSAAELGRQRAREDADDEYDITRDLEDAKTDEEKAQIQVRYARYRHELSRRRKLDDDERAIKAKEDEAALQASFRKAQADLAKRRLAEQEERDFRAQQETQRRTFEDGLAQEALDKQIDKLETERDERIRTIGEALDEKLRQIRQNENDERETLRKSHEQKLADLKERFLDRVGPLTDEALSAFERLFDGIHQRITDSTAAISSLAEAMGRAAQGTLPEASGGGAAAGAGGGATWANQSQGVRDMFTATHGSGAQSQWEQEHAGELGQAAAAAAADMPQPTGRDSITGLPTGPGYFEPVPNTAYWRENIGRFNPLAYGDEYPEAAFGSSDSTSRDVFGGNNTSVYDQYAEGGVVPGPVGAARRALVHGGETVFTPDQLEALSQYRLDVPVGRGADGGRSGEYTGASIDYQELARCLAQHPIVVQMNGETVARIVRTELLKHKQRNGGTTGL